MGKKSSCVVSAVLTEEQPPCTRNRKRSLQPPKKRKIAEDESSIVESSNQIEPVTKKKKKGTKKEKNIESAMPAEIEPEIKDAETAKYKDGDKDIEEMGESASVQEEYVQDNMKDDTEENMENTENCKETNDDTKEGIECQLEHDYNDSTFQADLSDVAEVSLDANIKKDIDPEATRNSLPPEDILNKKLALRNQYVCVLCFKGCYTKKSLEYHIKFKHKIGLQMYEAVEYGAIDRTEVDKFTVQEALAKLAVMEVREKIQVTAQRPTTKKTKAVELDDRTEVERTIQEIRDKIEFDNRTLEMKVEPTALKIKGRTRITTQKQQIDRPKAKSKTETQLQELACPSCGAKYKETSKVNLADFHIFVVLISNYLRQRR